MINAAEARQMTKAYFHKEASNHLEAIQRIIKDVASHGGWRCRYACDISGACLEVRNSVMSTLIESGFNAAWADSGSAIIISWEEA